MQLTQQHSDFMDSIYNEVVGVNIGTGYVKMACGGRRLQETMSLVARVNDLAEVEDTYEPDDIVFEYEGQRIAVGKAALRLGSPTAADRSSERLLTDDYLFLFLGGLSQLLPYDRRRNNIEITPRRIVLIVPLSSYNNDREKIKQYLSGRHVVNLVKDGRVNRTITYCIEKEAISVLPEGRGTLAALTITEEGIPYDPKGYAEHSVGIINIGTGTTEGLMYVNAKPVAAKTWDLGNVGLSNVWKSIADYAQHKKNFRMDDVQKNDAFRSGGFYIGQKWEDVSDIKTSAVKAMVRPIVNMTNTHWQGGKEAYFLLASGGGADTCFGELSKVYDHIELVRDSIYAEAVGALFYGYWKECSAAGILKAYA